MSLLDETGATAGSASFAGLDSGTATHTAVFTLDAADWGAGDLLLSIDGPGDVAECDESDNTVSLGDWPCD